jgi:sortase (surface protein transpeptidase)
MASKRNIRHALNGAIFAAAVVAVFSVNFMQPRYTPVLAEPLAQEPRTTVLADATLTSSAVPAADTAQDTPIPAVNVTPAPVSVPVRIKIDSLKLDATIDKVGKQKDGSIGVPYKIDHVGWYSESAKIGEKASVVLVGHNQGVRTPAIFADLHEIKMNETIAISTEDGKTSEFKVVSQEKYSYDAVPMDRVVNDYHDATVLKIVTCGGSWVDKINSYDERLIVTAVLK